MQRFLAEKLSFDQLFRMSEPKRVVRSHTVKGPPLEIDTYNDAVYHIFDFKSSPSTTGLRHKGYVKFLRPRKGSMKPLQHLDCVVDCTCPDYRYRWSWANKQRGASRVGPKSLNQAWNKAPRITNPSSRPGLCKHILATRDYIYDLMSSFPDDSTADTADRLNKLTSCATKRWINMPQQMAKAREREGRYAAGRQARNIGKEPYQVPAETDQDAETVPVAQPGDTEGRKPGDDESYVSIVPPAIQGAPELEQLPAPPSFASNVTPPGSRGRSLPTPSVKVPAQPPLDEPDVSAEENVDNDAVKDIRRLRKADDLEDIPDKSAKTAADAKFRSPAEYNFTRRRGLGDSIERSVTDQRWKEKSNCVVKTNGVKNMNTLTEAQRIISELEQDEQSEKPAPRSRPKKPASEPELQDAFDDIKDFEGDAGLEGGPDVSMPSPNEPPVSNSAIGIDTQGSEAIVLLREIRDMLGQLNSALVPTDELSPEGDAADFDSMLADDDMLADDEIGVPEQDETEEVADWDGEEDGDGEEDEEKD